METKEILRIKNLKKTFSDKEVLKDINLVIKKREIIGITGKSGEGKTTLLRIINMLEHQDDGNIKIFQKEVKHIKKDLETRRKISMVFQKPLLLNESIHYNASFGLKLRKINKEQIKKEVNNHLNRFKIKDKKQNVNKLSGGEIQRIALIQAMIVKPEILILDEPSANLDNNNLEILNEMIFELRDKHDTTIIIGSHDLEHIKNICDRIYHLEKGILTQTKK
ncbi:MAG: ABC transporter ATP-binding protein [Candidatus Woesearchaeota archaeon]|jgi:tungstate transport system ATP-binding protein